MSKVNSNAVALWIVGASAGYMANGFRGAAVGLIITCVFTLALTFVPDSWGR